MFLKCSTRRKNGKEHRSWSIVESRRIGDGRCVQRHVLYLGEISDSQQTAWSKSIAVFDDTEKGHVQTSIFSGGAIATASGLSVAPSATFLAKTVAWLSTTLFTAAWTS